ncbi:hypothetical protein ACFWB1_30945 [Streptomyces goshikiensis]|uniref:hypothetical protein n=1 Tax=Streptomyces goshikiensis TaxID=1942 RepID=UPI0036B4FA07
MSALALMVVLLLVLVTLLVGGVVVYVLHRHPALTAPVMGGGTAIALVVSCVVGVMSSR